MLPLTRGILLALLCTVVACKKNHSRQPYRPQIGILSVQLSDSAADRVRAVCVTVASVEVLGAETGGWRTVAAPGQTVDLLTLVNGVRHPLAKTPIAAGHYSRIRVVLGQTAQSVAHPFANYVVDAANATHELRLDSARSRALEVVRPFEVRAGETTELLADFDVAKSIVLPGADGAWRLAPSGRLDDVATTAIITGRTGEPGVTVSATRLGQESPAAITISGESGHYAITVPAGAYTVVATAAGRILQSREVHLHTAGNGTADFRLPATATGVLTGRVDFADATGHPHAMISIRTTIESRDVEVDRINVADGGRYLAVLPAGRYRLVAWSEGTATTRGELVLRADVTHAFDFAF